MSHAFSPDATDAERQALSSVQEQAFVESYGPETHESEAYAYAVVSYRDFQRYGLPRPGGSLRQSVSWKIAVDLVYDALRHGEAEAENFAAFAE